MILSGVTLKISQKFQYLYKKKEVVQMQNQNNDFVNGLFVDLMQTQYGTITKLGIHRENFINWLNQQQVNEKGYLKP